VLHRGIEGEALEVEVELLVIAREISLVDQLAVADDDDRMHLRETLILQHLVDPAAEVSREPR